MRQLRFNQLSGRARVPNCKIFLFKTAPTSRLSLVICRGFLLACTLHTSYSLNPNLFNQLCSSPQKLFSSPQNSSSKDCSSAANAQSTSLNRDVYFLNLNADDNVVVDLLLLLLLLHKSHLNFVPRRQLQNSFE